MKNIDKIRAMSAEELANLIVTKNTDSCEDCMASKYCKSEKNTSDCCERIIEIWLKKEYEKPMPEIKAGDYIVYEKDGCLCRAVCVFGNIVYRIDRGGCCNYGGEMQEKTISIKRYDITNGTLEDIWRADNGN